MANIFIEHRDRWLALSEIDYLGQFVRGLYLQAGPRLIANLFEGSYQPIRCSACEFKCGPDYLFAGIVEALYLMRCTLFHGELVPTKDTIACYEPAYRLVRRFLDCVS